MRKQLRKGWAISSWRQNDQGVWQPVLHYYREQPTKPRWSAPCGAREIPVNADVQPLTSLAHLKRNGQPVVAIVCERCRDKANHDAWREKQRQIKELMG